MPYDRLAVPPREAAVLERDPLLWQRRPLPSLVAGHIWFAIVHVVAFVWKLGIVLGGLAMTASIVWNFYHVLRFVYSVLATGWT